MEDIDDDFFDGMTVAAHAPASTMGDAEERRRIVEASAMAAVENWKAIAQQHLSTDPLVWWKANWQLHAGVAQIARRVLCVPTTSAPAERVGSTAGNISGRKRANLDSDMVRDLVLLHDSSEDVDEMTNSNSKQAC